MKKIIDIDESLYKKLKKHCIDVGTNAKSWIENLVNREISKIKKPE